MGFIDSYKHLDKLCGEVMNDDKRLSAYIDEMLKTTWGARLVGGWEDDLKQLKHYRWIRNQIAHEPDCREENMCEPNDALWLDHFYSRIMNQTDPLALYAKATKPRTVLPQQQEEAVPSSYPIFEVKIRTTPKAAQIDTGFTQGAYRQARDKRTSGRSFGWVIFVLFILAIIAAVILICNKR